MLTFCPMPLRAADDRDVQDAFRTLLSTYLATSHRKRVEVIQRAFRFAVEAHRGRRRINGDASILHSIQVAQIVCHDLGLGSTSICAALLHEVLDNPDYTYEDILNTFGEKVASMVLSLHKISGGIFGDRAEDEAERFRKLLLSMSADVRVILVKMADRLCNMRTLDCLLPAKQQKIARETLYVYAPLAHRLGLNAIKTELEDLSFRYMHPERHAEILQKIRLSEEERSALVEAFVAPIRTRLDEAGFKYEIKARVKTPYSIYKKMMKKDIPFEQVYDIFAVRIIFENEDEARERLRCWEVYTLITENHQAHPGRLRDWTVTPRGNGYRALHITVMGPDGRWVEVQIRSKKMDDIAELGLAAHWKYKTGEYTVAPQMDEWMNTVKELLANPGPDAVDFMETVKLSLFASEIYVFTPKGDLITLPSGASVLDMAFAIHTEVGLHCVAGKIRHRLVPPAHILSSGDQVEIITSDSQTPSEDWLDYCRTSTARHAMEKRLPSRFKKKET